MKQTWRVINDTLGKRNQKTTLPISIEHNNTLITDPNKKANTFNDYFANIGTNLAENICQYGNNEMYQQYLQTQSQCSCTFENVNEDDILRLQTTQPTSGGAVTANPNDLPFFGHAGHADPLDGWRCCSQKRVMSRPIQVRQL